MSNDFNANSINSVVNVNEFANGLTNIDVTRVVNTGIIQYLLGYSIIQYLLGYIAYTFLQVKIIFNI